MYPLYMVNMKGCCCFLTMEKYFLLLHIDNCQEKNFFLKKTTPQTDKKRRGRTPEMLINVLHETEREFSMVRGENMGALFPLENPSFAELGGRRKHRKVNEETTWETELLNCWFVFLACCFFPLLFSTLVTRFPVCSKICGFLNVAPVVNSLLYTLPVCK